MLLAHRYGSRSVIFWTALCGAGFFTSGCSGRQLDVGNPTTPLSTVDPGTITGPVSPCESGFAHPNVCCTGSSQSTASCTRATEAPFQACAAGATTYPDPTSCCAIPTGDGLLHPSACASPAPPSSMPPPPGKCTYLCPPGFVFTPEGYQEPLQGYTVGACCPTDPSVPGECVPNAGVYNCPTPGSSQAEAGAPCLEYGSDAAAPVIACGACPAGWQAPAGEPDLCCATASNGVISCFSQAAGPPASSAGDAGAGEAGSTMADGGKD